MRSRALLVLSLLLLAASGSLGAVLVHDAEVVSATAAVAAADEGKQIRLKGELDRWDQRADPLTRQMLLDHTATFRLDDVDLDILVTSDEEIPHGKWVVTAEVRHAAEHVLVLRPTSVDEPLVFR